MDRIVLLVILFALGLRSTEAQRGLSDPPTCDCHTSYGHNILNITTCICSHLNPSSNFAYLTNSDALVITCTTERRGSIGINAFGLENLQRLDIIGCSLFNVPPGAFLGLTSLQNLRLSTSASTVLSPGWLRGLQGLTSLDLSQNKLSYIDNKEFCNVPELQSLNVSFNRVREQSNLGIVGGCLTGLVSLDISSNPLQSLDLRLNNSVPSLLAIHMKNCRLTRIGETVFQGTKLISMSMSLNPLGSVPVGLFDGLADLEILIMDEISTNGALQLPSSLFNTTRSMEILSLTGNQISDKSENGLSFLENFPNLEILFLDSNNITEIGSMLFSNNSNLRILVLSNNTISKVDGQAFSVTPNLKTLILNENALQEIEIDTFGNLTYLERLDIRGNGIRKIPRFAFASQTVNLTQLTVADNRLDKEALQALSSLRALTVLDLRNASKFQIDVGILKKMTHLRILHLHENNMPECPVDAFVSNTQLEYLDLSHNSMLTLQPGCFNGLENLEYLFLENNDLEVLQFGMFPLSLTAVDISYNDITYVGRSTFEGLHNLTFVDLRFNRISNLSPSSLNFTTTARLTFLVRGNDLVCSCIAISDKGFNYLQCEGHRIISSLEGVTTFDTYLQRNLVFCKYVSECHERACNCCAPPFSVVCDCAGRCPSRASVCFANYDRSVNIIHHRRDGLREVPNSLPTTVTTLDLSGNNFKVLKSGEFVDQVQLLLLRMNGSRIALIDRGAFLGLTRLRILHLEDNELMNIESDSFEPLGSLRRLLLHGNRLVALDVGGKGLSGYVGLSVSLYDNRFRCTCKVGMALQNWLKKQTPLGEAFCHKLIIPSGGRSGVPLSQVDFGSCLIGEQ